MLDPEGGSVLNSIQTTSLQAQVEAHTVQSGAKPQLCSFLILPTCYKDLQEKNPLPRPEKPVFISHLSSLSEQRWGRTRRQKNGDQHHHTAKRWTSTMFQVKPSVSLSKAQQQQVWFKSHTQIKWWFVPGKELVCKTNNIEHIFKTLPDFFFHETYTVSSTLTECAHVQETFGYSDSGSLAGRKERLSNGKVWWVNEVYFRNILHFCSDQFTVSWVNRILMNITDRRNTPEIDYYFSTPWIQTQNIYLNRKLHKMGPNKLFNDILVIQSF